MLTGSLPFAAPELISTFLFRIIFGSVQFGFAQSSATEFISAFWFSAAGVQALCCSPWGQRVSLVQFSTFWVQCCWAVLSHKQGVVASPVPKVRSEQVPQLTNASSSWLRHPTPPAAARLKQALCSLNELWVFVDVSYYFKVTFIECAFIKHKTNKIYVVDDNGIPPPAYNIAFINLNTIFIFSIL